MTAAVGQWGCSRSSPPPAAGLSVPQPRAATAVVTGKYHEWGSHNPPFLPSRPRYRRFKPCEAAGGGGAVPWLCLTAASRPRLSPAMRRGPPRRGRGRSQVEPGDKSLWFCLQSLPAGRNGLVFCLHQSRQGCVNGPLGCFLARRSHPAVCLEYKQSLRVLAADVA